jgi:hypothetical protein
MLSHIFLISTLIAYLLEVWFNTNAFIEYAILIGYKSLYIGEYIELQTNGYTESYLNFLNEYHNSFISRLVSCPTCLSFWLSTLLLLIINPYWILSCAFLSLLLYRILNKLV